MGKNDLSRPIKVHICKDGTISFRRNHEPVFNGRALPVFSVNSIEEAQDIQIRFGRRMHKEHPQIPGKPWYKLSVLRDGSDPALREKGLLELEDLEGITDMFREFWSKAQVSK